MVIRKKAIRLILDGTKKSQAAKIFGVKNGTITDWVKRYKSDGYSGLACKKKGVKSDDKKRLALKIRGKTLN